MISVGDAVQQIVDRLQQWREALLNRMLRHWDPAWGTPEIVEGPTSARIPLYGSLPIAAEQEAGKVSISILGLARRGENHRGQQAKVRISAVDHIGPDGWPLAAEGPWPLPGTTQFHAWLEKDRAEVAYDKWTLIMEDFDAQVDECRSSLRRGYFATARGLLNGAKLAIDAAERDLVARDLAERIAGDGDKAEGLDLTCARIDNKLLPDEGA